MRLRGHHLKEARDYLDRRERFDRNFDATEYLRYQKSYLKEEGYCDEFFLAELDFFNKMYYKRKTIKIKILAELDELGLIKIEIRDNQIYGAVATEKGKQILKDKKYNSWIPE